MFLIPASVLWFANLALEAAPLAILIGAVCAAVVLIIVATAVGVVVIARRCVQLHRDRQRRQSIERYLAAIQAPYRG